MNFGIPFKRPWGIPFGVPFLGSGAGGSGPVFPSSGNVGYYTPFDITKLGFSSANNVNLVVDQSTASNDLTQGTASANMAFNEHDTVTQYTSANQPTLVDTGGGVLALNFPVGNANLAGYDNPTDDFTFEWDGTFLDDDDERFLQASTSSNTRCLYNGSLSITADDLVGFSFTGIPDLLNTRAKVIFRKTGNSMECFVDGVSYGIKDVTGKTFYLYDTIGYNGFSRSANCNLFAFRVYGESIADPNNITEVPRWEFLPTVETCNVVVGQQVSRWNSTTHKPWLNTIQCKPTQFLEGLSPQNGNFTYIVDAKLTNPSVAGAMLSSNIDSSGFFNIDDDTLDVRDGAGTNNNFDVETIDDFAVFAFTFDGVNLNMYKNSCLSASAPIDATGQAFNLTSISKATSGAEMLWRRDVVYNRELTKEELDYFSYIRNEETNEFLEPLQLPVCPLAPLIYPVNSANLNGSSQYFTFSKPTGFDTSASFSFKAWFKTNSPQGGRILNGVYEPAGADCFLAISSGLGGQDLVTFGANNGGSWTASNHVTSVDTFKDDLWHMAVGVYNDSDNTLKIYVDVVLQGTTNSAPTPVDSASMAFAIGRYEAQSLEYFLGSIYEPEIFTEALTLTQIQDLYNIGVSLCYEDRDSSLTDNSIYAPKLGNYDTNTGSELVDQSSNMVTTANNGSTPFTGTGLTVECN